MRSFHDWLVRPIAVLAVVFFSSANVAQSADPAAATIAAPAPLPVPAAEKVAPPPGAQPAAKEEAGPSPESPRRRRDRSSRSDGNRATADEGVPRSSGREFAPSATSGKPSGDAPRKKAEKLRFQFRFQPWKDVLEWFAQQADLSLIMDSPPPGTFNYSDTREYTPGEAIDLLNSVLQTKGYTLLRKERLLLLINNEDLIPPNLVSTVPVDSLDGRGESELVNVQFNLTKIRPEKIEAEVQKLLGPQGSVKALAESQQLSATDTVGHLRDGPRLSETHRRSRGDLASGLKTFHLKYARPEEAMSILRQLLEIPEDKIAATDGSIRVVQEPGTDRLLVSGRPDKVARATEIIEKLDVPTPGAEGAGTSSPSGQRGHVRTLPMNEASARAALQRIEEIWPNMRPNKIRIVSPSAGSGPAPATDGAEPPRGLPDQPRSPRPKPQEGPKAPPVPKVTMAGQGPAGKLFGARIFCVADPVPPPGTPGRPDMQSQAGKPDLQPSTKAPVEAKPPAPITVIPGANGLTIISDDLEALDEFERLLATTSGGSGNGPMAVFYLKYATCQSVADELDKILAGGVSDSDSSADKSSDAKRLAANRRALATGPIKITPEPRLNALLVLANRADQDTIKQLLEILDLKESPEDVEVAPKPRMIPVAHARASDIADVLRQLYADRLIVAQPQGGQQGGRGGGALLPLLMRGMGGGFGGGGAPTTAVLAAAVSAAAGAAVASVAAVELPAAEAASAEADRTGATTPTASRSASTPTRTPWSSAQRTPCSKRSNNWCSNSTWRPPRKTIRCR